MIKITKYEVVNGSKSEPFIIDRDFSTQKDVEQFREELEQKHHCWKTDLSGRRKVKDILFTKIEIP